MPLASGTRLGPYEILSALGAGGMGEVYKARDTRLDRTVAIKILPEALAADPQFRDRFEREAKAIAALTHPHICTLHDVGRQDGTEYLVMELLEGETLEARLKKGALPLDQALKTGIEIASALDKAHRAGIVHRDLKPGNIMLTKAGAKLLDFGLAKNGAPVVAGAGLSMLPTTPPNLTAQGTILGTFQYMAPEQLEGQAADTRTDIFAFGAVVYEMLTGRKAFEGKSQAGLIGAIMHSEPPPVSTLQPLLPPALERVVKKCLAKAADERWQSATDLADEVKWVAATLDAPVKVEPGTARRSWTTAAASVATVGLIFLVYVGLLRSKDSVSTPPVLRLSIATPRLDPNYNPVLSPDGRSVVFRAYNASGVAALWIRSLDSTLAKPLSSTPRTTYPFWSPDGRFLGFVEGGVLTKLELSSGATKSICDVDNFAGGTWNTDGTIVFAESRRGLWRVDADGGKPVQLFGLDSARQENGLAWPAFLPGGRRFLYASNGKERDVCLASLDSPERGCLGVGGSTAEYAEPGYLFFAKAATLMAQPFDPETARLSGEPVAVADDVGVDTRGRLRISFSKTGLLTYAVAGNDALEQLVWIDRSGSRIGAVGEPARVTNLDLSRDGRYVLLSIRGAPTITVWMIDTRTGVMSKIVSEDHGGGNNPKWAPDGRQFAFSRAGSIFAQPAFGGPERVLFKNSGSGVVYSEDWSRDGQWVMVNTNDGGQRRGYAARVDGIGSPLIIADARATQDEYHFSADVKWVAYNSDVSGRSEIFVTPMPPTGQKWQVSNAGGVQPRWRDDGRELYYLALDGTMMAADIQPGARFEASAPRPLFKTEVNVDANLDQYVVQPDGKRFLFRLPIEQANSSLITVIVNWPAMLRK